MLKFFEKEECLTIKVKKGLLPPLFMETYSKLTDLVEKPINGKASMFSEMTGKKVVVLNKEMLDATILSCGLSKLLSEYKNFEEGKMVDFGFLKFGSQIMERGRTNAGGEETKRYFID